MARLDRGSVSGAACGSGAPAIEVRGLSFAYPGAAAPVRPLTVSAPRL